MMDKSYILIIKGFIVGLGKIIPGVSGALLAISMGIYDKALDSIGNFFKDVKTNIKFLMPIGIGVLCAIIFFSNIISFLLNKYYVITMLLFLGLIVGGIPSLFKVFNKNKINAKDYIFIFVVILTTILLYSFINDGLNFKNVKDNFVIFWLLVGSVDALTMIIPGISGTAIFVMLGCFNDIINIYANPFSNIKSIIPFLIGIVLIIMLVTKLISFLFRECSKSMYLFIIFLLFISLISLINNIFTFPFTIIELIIGLILFLIGFSITYKLEK